MKIVNIIGGLGNQMFQYAFAQVLKHHYPKEEVLIDTHHFHHYPLHNGYEIEKVFPNAKLPVATPKQIRKVSWYVPHYKIWRMIRRCSLKRTSEYIQKKGYIYDSTVFSMSSDIYFEGYWQHYKYFEGMKSEFLRIFQFPTANGKNELIAEQMRRVPSVGIHVRRGDYIGNKGFDGICTFDYYKKALEELEITSDTKFFVFSNDIPWCEVNLKPLLGDVNYVDWNQGQNSFWDIYLMSQCQQLIIANSSFSWWGAYLNQYSQKTIAPKLWDRLAKYVYIQMPEWQLV